MDAAEQIHDELWCAAEAERAGLRREEWAAVLMTVGRKYNFGLLPGKLPTQDQMETFWRGLQLKDLALAHGCALGREAAWQLFLARFKAPLTQAAIGITGSAQRGQELADSLYGELFGLTHSGEARRSPFEYYSGRGSLIGFLRTTLAQRNVDAHRRTSRETPLVNQEIAAMAGVPPTAPDVLRRLGQSLATALAALEPEERFLLSAWFLDGRTLADIARLLRVHEATVSRRMQRLTQRIHVQLIERLVSSGMSRRAAEEALGTDPRDVDVNLRGLLQSPPQSSPPAPFQEQGTDGEKDGQ
ncbi:MAG: hypothetical protein JNL62_07955 [Bryobacterales bacterium]|nr:hypothetical protein [Bryobacterales bacterium]